MNKLTWISAGLISLTGCGSEATLDIGDERAELGQAVSDYAASWDGYAQAMEFPGDGTDRIRIVLDDSGNGTVRFGEEELFPAPTDPDVLYPPTYPRPEWEFEGLDSFLAGVRSGFEFSVENASVVDGRLRLRFSDSQVMSGWCALQGENPLPEWTCQRGGYGYLGDVGECMYTTEEGDYPISCHRALQCGECSCDEEGCSAREEQDSEILIDAALSEDGSELTGTLLLPDDLGGRVTIVMYN